MVIYSYLNLSQKHFFLTSPTFIVFWLLIVFFGTSPIQASDELSDKLAPKKEARILSLQGGGARGYIELVFLSELEKETGLPTYKLFDLFGGTSIGGILASTLTIPDNTEMSGSVQSARYTATYMLDQFESLSKGIFRKSCCCNVFGLCGPKYDSTGIREAAEDMFGGVTFDQSLKPTLVTAYDMTTTKPKFFKSWRPELGIFYTYDVALATSAAPTYFAPHLMESIGGETKGQTYRLLDGGTAVNDPSHCLTVEAKKIFGENYPLRIVSLGTGDLIKPLSFKSLKNAGILTWAPKIADILIDGEMGVTDYVMRKEYGDAYSYWNPEIDDVHSPMDSFKPSDFKYFKKVTLDMIQARKSEFVQLAASLVANAGDKKIEFFKD